MIDVLEFLCTVYKYSGGFHILRRALRYVFARALQLVR